MLPQCAWTMPLTTNVSMSIDAMRPEASPAKSHRSLGSIQIDSNFVAAITITPPATRPTRKSHEGTHEGARPAATWRAHAEERIPAGDDAFATQAPRS